MKTELIMLANAYMEVRSWKDFTGTHSQIVRTVPYEAVSGLEISDVEVVLNKYERIQPQPSKGR